MTRPPLHLVSDADRAQVREMLTRANEPLEVSPRLVRAKLQADNRSFTVRSLGKLFGFGAIK